MQSRNKSSKLFEKKDYYRIKEIIADSGTTMTRAANKLNMSRSRLCNIISGRCWVSDKVYNKIYNYFVDLERGK